MKSIFALILTAFAITSIASDKGVVQGIIPLGSFMILQIDANTITAQGTWATVNPASADDRVAYPVNFTKIRCERALKVCAAADGDIKGNQYLWLNLTLIDVTRWTDQEIVLEDDGLCVSNEITINLVKKEVYEISKEGGVSKGDCANSIHTAMKAPIIMKLMEPMTALRADPRTTFK